VTPLPFPAISFGFLTLEFRGDLPVTLHQSRAHVLDSVVKRLINFDPGDLLYGHSGVFDFRRFGHIAVLETPLPFCVMGFGTDGMAGADAAGFAWVAALPLMGVGVGSAGATERGATERPGFGVCGGRISPPALYFGRPD
jgi:hypothetical protein